MWGCLLSQLWLELEARLVGGWLRIRLKLITAGAWSFLSLATIIFDSLRFILGRAGGWGGGVSMFWNSKIFWNIWGGREISNLEHFPIFCVFLVTPIFSNTVPPNRMIVGGTVPQNSLSPLSRCTIRMLECEYNPVYDIILCFAICKIIKIHMHWLRWQVVSKWYLHP